MRTFSMTMTAMTARTGTPAIPTRCKEFKVLPFKLLTFATVTCVWTTSAFAIDQNEMQAALQRHICPAQKIDTTHMPNYDICEPLWKTERAQFAVNECQNEQDHIWHLAEKYNDAYKACHANEAPAPTDNGSIKQKISVAREKLETSQISIQQVEKRLAEDQKTARQKILDLERSKVKLQGQEEIEQQKRAVEAQRLADEQQRIAATEAKRLAEQQYLQNRDTLPPTSANPKAAPRSPPRQPTSATNDDSADDDPIAKNERELQCVYAVLRQNGELNYEEREDLIVSTCGRHYYFK
jgi:hypothetical protein